MVGSVNRVNRSGCSESNSSLHFFCSHEREIVGWWEWDVVSRQLIVVGATVGSKVVGDDSKREHNERKRERKKRNGRRGEEEEEREEKKRNGEKKWGGVVVVGTRRDGF